MRFLTYREALVGGLYGDLSKMKCFTMDGRETKGVFDYAIVKERLHRDLDILVFKEVVAPGPYVQGTERTYQYEEDEVLFGVEEKEEPQC